MSCARRAMRPPVSLPQNGVERWTFYRRVRTLEKVTGYSSNLKGLEAGFVVIVGNEATGTLYKLLDPEQVPSSLDAPYLIPKAFELDDAVGVEAFTVYHCDSSVSEGALFNGEPVDGCRTFTSQVNKVSP